MKKFSAIRILYSKAMKFCAFFIFTFLSIVGSQDPMGKLHHAIPTALDTTNTSVSVMKVNVGRTAFMSCRVPNESRLHENGVSWIRRWDWQIVSAGMFVNINDGRFAVLHEDGSHDWILQIKFVELTDAGIYECQVHTSKNFVSNFVDLQVIEPVAVILGPEDIHVKTKFKLSITCVISKALHVPVLIEWLHRNLTLMDTGEKNDRVRVITTVQGTHTTSTIVVQDVKYRDSGTYVCASPNAKSANITVSVSEGDNVAAVQRRDGETRNSISCGASSEIFPIVMLLALTSSCLLGFEEASR